ncbi:MAG: hypothetical protein OJF60_000360 [Burkholderiaceae bacterium]|nr:MAG: hypothetical protein OJF60_000360 [Burkholderiaceae bacterium]
MEYFFANALCCKRLLAAGGAHGGRATKSATAQRDAAQCAAPALR